MRLYIAFKGASTLTEGSSEDCLGIFDSQQKAWEYLETTSDFDKSEWNKFRTTRIYHFDGELTFYWKVKEMELNVPEDLE